MKTQVTGTAGKRGAGRPKAEEGLAAEKILDAALEAFGNYGYDGVSVRTLNRELGVSHNLINQRFGSKRELWKAAVDYAFAPMIAEVSARFDPAGTDPLEGLRAMIRAFIGFSATHPHILGLMNFEARQESDRLDYIFNTYIWPVEQGIGLLLEELAAAGEIKQVSLSTLHCLVTHGGAAPFTLAPLTARLDAGRVADPEAIDQHARLVADVLVDGLRIRD
ncbi:MAG: TetR/AcrR family transcriptional regulator [Solirubrobacterales bacterium]